MVFIALGTYIFVQLASLAVTKKKIHKNQQQSKLFINEIAFHPRHHRLCLFRISFFFFILFINFLVFCFFYFQGVEFAAPNAEILAASTVAAANNQAHQHPDAIALPDHQISAFNNSHILGLDLN